MGNDPLETEAAMDMNTDRKLKNKDEDLEMADIQGNSTPGRTPQ